MNDAPWPRVANGATYYTNWEARPVVWWDELTSRHQPGDEGFHAGYCSADRRAAKHGFSLVTRDEAIRGLGLAADDRDEAVEAWLDGFVDGWHSLFCE